MRYLPLFPVLIGLSACTLGPDYQRPEALVPPDYKELQGWKPSDPADEMDRGPWWSVYNDSLLNDLVSQVEISNQTLKASAAAFDLAYATAQAARAGRFPTLDTSPSVKRAGQSGVIANSISLPLTASWDLDIWGKIRRTVEANEATAEATAGDLASAKLSAQSQLAIDYFELRIQDQLIRIFQAAMDAYGQSLRITQNQYKSGVASRADVAQAETQLKTTQANLINVNVLRGQLEHAIAVLIGKPPADFTIIPAPLVAEVPIAPIGVPSTLLERRPDIAAAERRVAAANANIGVAEAAFYPDLSLSATFGFTGTALTGLLKAKNQVWSVGPTVTQNIFDAGLRQAQVDEAHATWLQSVANYRQTVLVAFQQVEDALTSLKVLEQEADVWLDAVKSAHEAERLILNQYKAGTVAYTSVITAQTAALTDEESALTVTENRLVASVNLIQYLGGGWSTAQLPKIE